MDAAEMRRRIEQALSDYARALKKKPIEYAAVARARRFRAGEAEIREWISGLTG